MPQLGETVTEGKITKWFKSAGDAVKPGDNLFEIETDKVSMEVPSITAGTLSEIKVQAGGLLGLQAQLFPERADSDEVTDVFGLLNAADARFGGTDDFPYQDIVQYIARYKNRTRRGER